MKLTPRELLLPKKALYISCTEYLSFIEKEFCWRRFNSKPYKHYLRACSNPLCYPVLSMLPMLRAKKKDFKLCLNPSYLTWLYILNIVFVSCLVWGGKKMYNLTFNRGLTSLVKKKSGDNCYFLEWLIHWWIIQIFKLYFSEKMSTASLMSNYLWEKKFTWLIH